MVNHQLSLNELAKISGEPYTTMFSLMRRGELIPDAVSGRYLLYDARRVPGIQHFLDTRRTRSARSELTHTAF
jgi:hypothetical protein